MCSRYTFTECLQVLYTASFRYYCFTVRECKNDKTMASGKVLAALCSLIILSSFITSADSVSCCLRYRRHRFPCKPLLGYTIQTINGSCDINAVIFHLPGRFICADPLSGHTKRAMACINNRTKNMQFLQEGTKNTTASQ
ncbi:uncharacterized protein V6R79_014878 [Siganus canaliculatus]